tara:strand:- start:439 stop:618 length:180 start_codon:yes stop_codon:yes gene_type:complete
MSYHDYPPPERVGISVVNPLHEIQKKLNKIQDTLDNISDYSVLTAIDLKTKIQNILDGE